MKIETILLGLDGRKWPALFWARAYIYTLIFAYFKSWWMFNTRSNMTYVYKTMRSPVGELTLVASNRGITAILWENDSPRRVRLAPKVRDDAHPILCEAESQLNEYFARARTTFSFPIDVQGTDFQKKVWAALRTIPFGETRSYAQIARQIGHPTAVRAVGAANGRNPVSIATPCHRVIGASGKLTGFAGGLEAKAYLLALEGQGELLRS